jgi:hypothetical protein
MEWNSAGQCVLVQPEMENRRFSVSEYTAVSAGQFGTIPEMA